MKLIPDNTLSTAMGWLYTQFRRSKNLIKIIRAVAAELQEVEDESIAVLAGMLIDDATGINLDRWGKLVGERRDGKTDDIYRRFIAVRIARNLSQGRVEQLIYIARELTGASVRLTELYPAAIAFELDGDIEPEIASRIRAILQTVVAGGVKVAHVTESAGEDAFAFDSGPGFDEGELSRLI